MTKPKYYLKTFQQALKIYHEKYPAATLKRAVCGIEKKWWNEMRLLNKAPSKAENKYSKVKTVDSYFVVPINCLTKRYETERRAK